MKTEKYRQSMTNEVLHFWAVDAQAEIERLRRDAELLAWMLAHPETAAEELGDAAAGEGSARSNIENRRAGIAAARFGAA